MAKKTYEDYLKELQKRSKNLTYKPQVYSNDTSGVSNKEMVMSYAKKKNIAIDPSSPYMQPTLNSVAAKTKKNQDKYAALKSLSPGSGFASYEQKYRDDLAKETQRYNDEIKNTLRYKNYEKEEKKRIDDYNKKHKDETLLGTVLNTGVQLGTGIVKFGENQIDSLVNWATDNKKNPYLSIFDPDVSLKDKALNVGKQTLAKGAKVYSMVTNNNLLGQTAKLGSDVLEQSTKDSEWTKKVDEKGKKIVTKDLTAMVKDKLGYNNKLDNGETVQEYLDRKSAIKSDNFGGRIVENMGEQIPSMIVAASGSPTASMTLFGTSAYGNALEQAYNAGATREQAENYATISAATEVATEYMFAGIGGVVGKGALDDVVVEGIKKRIKSGVGSYIAGLVAAGVGEGIEELASDLVQPIALKLTYMKDADLKKLYEDQDYFNDFLAGAISSVALGGSTQLLTGQTAAEIKTKNKYNNALNNVIKEAENKKGSSLTQIEKNNIATKFKEEYDKAVQNNQNVNNQDIINNNVKIPNRVLPGINQNSVENNYRSEYRKLMQEKSSLETRLRRSQQNYSEYAKRLEQVNSTENRTRFEQWGNDVRETQNKLLELDEKVKTLKENYKNKDNYYQYVKSENKKIDDLRKDIVANKWYNSDYTNNYVNMLEQIITDKGVAIRLDPNLKDNNGNAANGSYKNGVITINPNSNRAGEFIAIHELTHAIGTDSMRNIVNKYMQSNAEFRTAVNELLSKTYNTTELTEEAMADVAGQLFGNQEFINNLSQTNPSKFRQIYNEIKYLWHQFRGYKNQNQFIEDLMFKWEQAYRNNKELNQTFNESKTEMSDSLDNRRKKLSIEQQKYFKDSKIRDKNGNLQRMYHGSDNGNFTVFNQNKVGENLFPAFGEGFYFAKDKATAQAYTNNDNVKTVYLDIKNPYYASDAEVGKLHREDLIKQGYDGVSVYGGNEVVAFYPEQIKNIDNLNPTNNQDIRYSKIENNALTEDIIEDIKEYKKGTESVYESIKASRFKEMLNAVGIEVPKAFNRVLEVNMDGGVLVTSGTSKQQLSTIYNTINDFKDKINNIEKINYSKNENNSLSKQLEKQGTKILEESELKRQGMIDNFKTYLEENNITNPTQEDIDNSIVDLMSYDNEQSAIDNARDEKLYNKYVREYMKENNIPNDRRSPVSDNLISFTENQKKSILRGKDNVIANNKKELSNYTIEALRDNKTKKNVYLGVIPQKVINNIIEKVQDISIENKNNLFDNSKEYQLAVNQDEIRHLHKEGLTETDVVNFIDTLDELISDFDSVRYSVYNNNQKALRFKKNMKDGTHIALEILSKQKGTMRTQTLFLDKADFIAYKKRSFSPTLNEFKNSLSKTSEMDGVQTPSTKNIPQSKENVKYNTKYSKENKEWEKFVDKNVSPGSESNNDSLFSRAKQELGTTNDLNEAGFLTPDGTYIDFSGKKDGGTPGKRSMDHRDIGQIYTDAEYKAAENKYSNMGTATAIMQDFIDNGNIRLMPEQGIDISAEPTAEQYDKLYDYIDFVKERNGEIFVDLESETKNRENLEYDSKISTKKIIDDIKKHYENSTTNQEQTNTNTSNNTELDSQGRELSKQQQEYFKDSKARDENGNLEVVYHGTANGEFTIFDRSYGNVENDFGKGFYFTNQEYDVDSNYYDGGPDFDAKISRLAERIEQDEGISYEKAKEKAKKQLYKGGNKISAYLNIVNPAVVGETRLFSYEDYLSDIESDLTEEASYYEDEINEYAKEYFDTEDISKLSEEDLKEARDEYLRDNGTYDEIINKYLEDDIENAVDAVNNELETYGDEIQKLRNLLWESVYEGGLEIEQLKSRINNELEFSNENGDLANNEAVRLIIESAGYDGIVDNTVSTKFKNMGIGNDVTHYITFKPEQIKRIDNINPTSNEDIRYSKNNKTWQKYLEDNFKSEGTKTNLKDLKLPVKKKPVLPTAEKMQNLPKNPTKETSYDNEVKRTRKQVREDLQKEMGITLEDLQVGKDINALDSQRTDPVRLNEKVFGAKIGQKINDATVYQTKHNEAERIRFLNKERSEIKELGIKPRSKESAAVQKYGEKQYVNDRGKVFKYGDAELAREFPNIRTQQKIKEAAKVLRQKYDTYIEDINNVITEMGYDPIHKRQDYMRHFQEINDKLSQWGIPFNQTDMKSDALPTDINGITDQFKPGKNWFASAMQRKGFKTTYDAITGIDGYLEGASNLIYHTGDIQRYRTLSKMIRDTYGQTHGMENVDVNTKEGQQRLNDIFDNKLSKYAAWLDEQANALAGKKAGIDRAVERIAGRRVYTAANTLKKQVGSNMTGFNVRTAMTNFASAVQGAAKTNKIAFLKGTLSTMRNIVHNDGLVNKSDFLTSRFGSDQLSKKLWQKASNAGQIFMTGTDYFTANQIWRSKYYENLSKGMTENQAIKNADDFAARIMGDRSKGATAEIFNSKTLGFLTQFQLEVNNQWSSIIHDNKMDIQRGNKSGAAVVFQLGELAAMSYFFNNFMRSATGSDVMIDPIEMLKKIFGDDDDEDKTIVQRTEEAFGDLLDDVPFASIMTGGRIPISEAFTGLSTLGKKWTGQKDKFGNDITWENVLDDMKSSIPYWVLPTGYGQLRKTKTGLSMYDKKLPLPGSYTKSGNLRFRADESTAGKVKAALFGQYTSEEARKYLDSGYKTVHAKKIQELKDLDFSASEYVKYRKELNEAGKSNAEKIHYIEDNDKYTEEQKNIMYKNVLDLKTTEQNKIEKLMDIKDQNKYMVAKTEASKIRADKDMESKEKKEEIVDIILKTNLDNDSMAYLYSKFYSTEEKIQDILNAEIPIKEFIKFDSQDFEGEFDEKKGQTKTNSKKYETINYVNGLNLSIPQKAFLIRTKYSSYDKYDKQVIDYINDLDLGKLEKYQLIKDANIKVYDKQIVDYINGLDKTKEEKTKILKAMGFTIHNGRVYVK